MSEPNIDTALVVDTSAEGHVLAIPDSGDKVFLKIPIAALRDATVARQIAEGAPQRSELGSAAYLDVGDLVTPATLADVISQQAQTIAEMAARIEALEAGGVTAPPDPNVATWGGVPATWGGAPATVAP